MLFNYTLKIPNIFAVIAEDIPCMVTDFCA